MAIIESPNTSPHLDSGWLVVIIVDFFSYLAAMAYSINRMDNLSNYLLDGRLPIDNNLAKRGMKSFVIGRKNWLFCFAENGAQMSSIAYSMVETAIANKLNVYEYLVYLFDTIPKINNDDVDNLRKLLPYSPDLPEYLKVQK